MKTHAIRPGIDTPVLRFTPEFETLLLQAHPVACRTLVLLLVHGLRAQVEDGQCKRLFAGKLAPEGDYSAPACTQWILHLACRRHVGGSLSDYLRHLDEERSASSVRPNKKTPFNTRDIAFSTLRGILQSSDSSK